MAASAAVTTHAALVVNYEFNEPAGGFSTAVNSGSGTIGAWGDNANASLNGSGQLEVTGPLGFQNRVLTGGSAISSGSAFLRIDFDSWGPAADPFFVFGMRAAGPTSTGPRSWRLQFSSGNGVSGDPMGRLFETSGNSMNSGFNFLEGDIPVEAGLNGSMPNGFSVIMGIDLDNDTTSVWWDPGRTGNYVIAGGRDTVAIAHNTGVTDFNLIDGIQLQGNGGPFAIDRLVLGTDFAEVAAIPEPGSATFCAGIAAWLISVRRRRRGPTVA